MKMKNELQLILARKIWTFLLWRSMQFKKNIVSSITLPVQSACGVYWSPERLFQLPFYLLINQCGPLSVLIFQTDHWESWMLLILLDSLQLLSKDMLFLNSRSHCFTLYMFHWGMALFLSNTSAQNGSPVQSWEECVIQMWFSHERNVKGSHRSHCLIYIMFNLPVNDRLLQS